MTDTEQKTEEQLHAEKYPLCHRWSMHHKEVMNIINFLGWLTNGDPSEYVDEGHNLCIAGYGRYSTRSISEGEDSTERFGIVLEQIAHGQEQLIPITTQNEDLAYAYLGINKQEIEKERRAMLEEFTGNNS